MFPFKIRTLMQLQELLEQSPDTEFLERIKKDPVEVLREINEPLGENEFSNYNIKSVGQLTEVLEKEPRMLDMLKQDPIEFFQKMVKEDPPPQYKIYRILVGSLCAVIIIIIIGVISAWFTKNSREAPTLITAVACTTLGILAGIFVNIPQKNYSEKSKNRYSDS